MNLRGKGLSSAFRRLGVRLLMLAVFLSICLGCAEKGALRNGYFTAETAYFDDNGWKEFVSLYIHNNRIVTVDYDAKNAAGFVRSWDMEIMREMNGQIGTYPNKYSRLYAQRLLTRQDPEKIDVIAGATRSHRVFCALAKAALDQARSGNMRVVLVK